MKKIYSFSILSLLTLLLVTIVMSSCDKTNTPAAAATVPPTPPSLSFTEDFNNVSGLAAKGWKFTNNSSPVGQTGWRQGRYEAVGSPSYKFPDGYIGFPAYNSTNSPNDFISCDVSCVNFTGDISAWLITPPMTIKNGDVLTFYTRAPNDANYPDSCVDRLQVLANTTDGSYDVGTTITSVGNFTKLLLDINPGYLKNAAGGYPETWTQMSITIAGLTGTVSNARIAFRYLGVQAGVDGPNYASIAAIDHIVFTSN